MFGVLMCSLMNSCANSDTEKENMGKGRRIQHELLNFPNGVVPATRDSLLAAGVGAAGVGRRRTWRLGIGHRYFPVDLGTDQRVITLITLHAVELALQSMPLTMGVID